MDYLFFFNLHNNRIQNLFLCKIYNLNQSLFLQLRDCKIIYLSAAFLIKVLCLETQI